MRNRAQIMVEYSVLIGIIVAALISMQIYLKRGAQGRIRGYANDLSGGFGYSPGAANANSLVTRTINEDSNSRAESDGPTGIRTSVSETNTSINQNTWRAEEILPLSAEPQR